jgi:hypothetical protein
VNINRSVDSLAGFSGAAKPKAITPAELAAVLTELRNAGIKPTPAIMSRALEKKGFSVSRPVADEAPQTPEDKIVRLSETTPFPERETFAARGQQYESELEQSRRTVAELQQELGEYRTALPDLLQREATLLHQLEIAAGKLLAAEREAAGIDTESLESPPVVDESLVTELAEQREQIEAFLQREKELTTQLEEASSRALLADKFETEIGELRATLAEFRDRETEWTELEQREQEGQLLAESLTRKVGDSAQALKDSQRRQLILERELDELRHQFEQAPDASALQSKLDAATLALDEAQREVRVQNAQLEELREQANRAESGNAGAADRETELLGRMEATAQRALQLEEQLATHVQTIDWSHEHAGQLHSRLLQTLESVSRLLPDGITSPAPATTSQSAGFEDQFLALEAVVSNLHGEIARAEEYQSFLKTELAKARQTPAAAADSSTGEPTIHLESEALGKYLAEIIEGELHRQSTALEELTRREVELRGQLEKAKPSSVKAQALETELSGQAGYREDMTRRKVGLAKLLEETIASLRAHKAG